MALTFDLVIWFLFATHRLVMVIICVKLFSNSTMHNKVLGRTRTDFTEVYAQSLSADCDLNLQPSDMVLVLDTSSCHDDHLCQTIFQSLLCTAKLWPGHGSGTHTHTHTHIHTHTHTHTHTEGKLYVPFRHFMAGA